MRVTMTWLLRRYIFVIDYTANDSSFTYDTEKIRRKNYFHTYMYIDILFVWLIICHESMFTWASKLNSRDMLFFTSLLIIMFLGIYDCIGLLIYNS